MELQNMIKLFEKVGGGKYTSIFDGWRLKEEMKTKCN